MYIGCSKEPSHLDSSFEYPQHMFWSRKKKNYFSLHTLIWRPEEGRTILFLTYLTHKLLAVKRIVSMRHTYDHQKHTGPRSAVGKCLATNVCLTADPGVASSIPAWYHTFVEIDNEIISTVILLPSADLFKKGCCQLQAKVCAQITG